MTAATGQESTEQARQRLICSCQGLVRSIAWKIHQGLPPDVDLEDLVSYGQVGLAEAARDFDCQRGNQFTTYAWYRVRGAILDGLSRMRWFNRGDFEAGRYQRMAHEALADSENGSDEAGGIAAGVIERQGAWLKGVSGALAVSCLASWSDHRAEADLADSGLESPDVIIMRREMAVRLRQLVSGLPADMAALVRSTYFEGKTLTQAAAEVGISKAWASRLHSRALGQLATALRGENLSD